MSAELLKAKVGKPKFLKWLRDKIRKDGMVEMTDAMYAGAKVADLSSQTIGRYLKEELSSEGMYETQSKDGFQYLVLRSRKGANNGTEDH